MAALPDRLLSLRHLTNAGAHHRGRVDSGGPWSANLRARTVKSRGVITPIPPFL